jgi:hypothetical protein
MSEPWIGLVGIIPNGDSSLLQPGKGAFVNVVTLATSNEEFAEKVEQCMSSYNAVVVEITECVPYASRIRDWNPDNEIKGLVATLNQPTQVLLSTLHTYPLTTH